MGACGCCSRSVGPSDAGPEAASWAFLVLVAPLLLAYGVFQSGQPGHIVGWQYYLCTPILIILFIILPGIAGCWAAVFMARYLDRSLFQATAVLILLAIVYLLTAYLQPEAASEQTLEVRVVDLTDRMLSKTQFAHFPFLPSYWLSNSITSCIIFLTFSYNTIISSYIYIS